MSIPATLPPRLTEFAQESDDVGRSDRLQLLPEMMSTSSAV